MLKNICTKEGMLEILRDNRPAAVLSLEEEDQFTVVTRIDPTSLAPIEGLAVLERESDAGELLDAAFLADLRKDLSVWERLPLRYGPFASMWVLADEPFAPAQPGAD